MKSWRNAGLVLGPFVVCTLVFGQNSQTGQNPPSPSDPKPAAPPSAKPADQDHPAPIKPIVADSPERPFRKPGYGRDAMVDRRIGALVRLRDLMFEKIKFAPETRKKLDAMFDDYMAGLLNSAQMPHTQPRVEDFSTPQELPELRKQLEAAKKEGSQEKIALVKAKIHAANIALEPCVIDEPAFFFNYIIKEMNEEQRTEFAPVLARWQLLRVADIAPDNDFKQLRRSTRDPALNKSEEQGKALDAIILEAFRSVPLDKARLDKDVMKELAAQTKPKVLEKLDPKQREHFEKTLEMLKRWDDEDPEIAKKMRERLKDHKPSHPYGGPVTQQELDAPPNP